MSYQRTLVIFKPDALRRRLVGRILQRFEDKGLIITHLELRQLTRNTLEQHYEMHQGKAFYEGLIKSMLRGDVIVAVIAGPFAIATVRNLVGDTYGARARPGTIRGDFSVGDPVSENLLHASDSEESAGREIRLFFEA